MLSKKAKYALKSVIYLAQHNDRYIQISEIIKNDGMPQKFVEAILLELKKKGFLESMRGKHGGYKLSKQPNDISVGDIVRFIDGGLAPVHCVSKLFYKKCNECANEETCEVRKAMKKVRDAIVEVMDKTSLEDAVNDKTRVEL